MRFRELRIAWSVTWGVLCLLLIVLWVRSFQQHETISLRGEANHYLTFGANSGTVHLSGIGVIPYPSSPNRWWYYHSERATEPHKLFDWTVGTPRWPAPSCLPFWLPIVLATAFAVTPWITWSHRFSLRTMLIVTTLVAVGLGVIVYAMR
jgi:hypothetical protein